MSDHAHELAELRSRIDHAVTKLLAHGHGRLEVDFDVNQAGRHRAILRVWKSWMHFIREDEVPARRGAGPPPR